MVDLVFRRAPLTGSPVDLVFGETEAAETTAAISLSAALPGLTLAAAIELPAALLDIAAMLPGLTLAADAEFDIGIPVYTARVTGAPWQPGARVHPAAAGGRWRQGEAMLRLAGPYAWRDGASLLVEHSQAWRHGAPLLVDYSIPWRHGSRTLADYSASWHHGARAAVRTATPWAQAAQLRASTAAPRRDGEELRTARAIPWQQGEQAFEDRRLSWRHGALSLLFRRLPWRQGALAETDGSTPFDPPLVDPPPDPCYTPPPGDAVDLLFDEAWSSITDLVFWCERHPIEGATYFIRKKDIYMTVHTVAVARLPDLLPLDVTTLSMSSDEGSFGWTLQMAGPSALLELLAPVAGAPGQVRVTIDGMEFVYAVEGLRRDRAFGRTTATITGRSLTALVGAPYMPEGTWLSTELATAQQLAEAALEFSGVTLDWQIDDWTVPAGAWSGAGTPLAAVSRIAGAVGAVLQSHRSEPQFVVLPRYPVLPWAWYESGTVVDVSISLAAVATDSYERADGPAYDSVYVSGQSQGVLGLVKITGTAGVVNAPMVTDELIGDEVAARQRGSAILGGTGPGARIGMTIPLLTGPMEPGILSVGQLLEIIEPGETWRGLLRGVTVNVELPSVRQTLTIERRT